LFLPLTHCLSFDTSQVGFFFSFKPRSTLCFSPLKL